MTSLSGGVFASPVEDIGDIFPKCTPKTTPNKKQTPQLIEGLQEPPKIKKKKKKKSSLPLDAAENPKKKATKKKKKKSSTSSNVVVDNIIDLR